MRVSSTWPCDRVRRIEGLQLLLLVTERIVPTARVHLFVRQPQAFGEALLGTRGLLRLLICNVAVQVSRQRVLIESRKQENLLDHWLVYVYVLANNATCEVSSHVDPTLFLGNQRSTHRLVLASWFNTWPCAVEFWGFQNQQSRTLWPDALFMAALRVPPSESCQQSGVGDDFETSR